MKKTVILLSILANAVLHSVRNASLGRKMRNIPTRIPLGMLRSVEKMHNIPPCIPLGMQPKQYKNQ